MKKVLVILLGSALVLTNCTNENTVNPKTELGKATITGLIYAELDNTVSGAEKAPAGTKVVAIINTKDLVVSPAAGGAYGVKYYETTVDGTGKYSIEVEVGNLPLEVQVVPADFAADVKQSATVTVRKNFIGAGASDAVEVFKNGTFLLDLSY